MLIFGATTPGLEKDKIRTGCYSCGSVTFGKFTLSCVAALCVCAWDGHQNTGAFGKKRPKYMPFPMPNTQTFRSRITQAKAVPGRCWDRPPHLRPQRGPSALLAMGDLHTQGRKISGGGKNSPKAPQPSRAALGVAQLRDSLGDGQEIRPPEGTGGATRAGALIFVGSRHLEGLRPARKGKSPRPRRTVADTKDPQDSP